MVRNILGVVAGAIIAVVIISAAQAVIPYFAGPVGIDPIEDPAAYMQAMPAMALIGVLLSYLAGSLAGGFTAAAVVREPWGAWAVAVLLLVSAVANVMMLPHPVWFIVGSVVLIAAGGWFSGQIFAGARRPSVDEDDALAPPPYDAPEAQGWPSQGYDDPAPASEHAEPAEPERPRWTPMPPRGDA